MSKIALGLFIFSLSFHTMASGVLLLRARVPATLRILTTWGNNGTTPETTILSNDRLAHRRPKLKIERTKEIYKITVVQS